MTIKSFLLRFILVIFIMLGYYQFTGGFQQLFLLITKDSMGINQATELFANIQHFIFWFFMIIILIFIYFTNKNNNETRILNEILFEKVDIEKYIQLIKEKIEKSKFAKSYNTSKMDLATGLIAQGDFEKAIEAMKSIDPKKLPLYDRGFYYNNLAAMQADNDKLNDAIETFNKGIGYINSQLTNNQYDGYRLKTLAKIELLKGNYEKAEELLLIALNKPLLNHHYVNSINLLLAKVYIKTNRTDQARKILEYTMTRKMMPVTKKETEELLNKIKEK